jgi:hypothetical protein
LNSIYIAVQLAFTSDHQQNGGPIGRWLGFGAARSKIRWRPVSIKIAETAIKYLGTENEKTGQSCNPSE